MMQFMMGRRPASADRSLCFSFLLFCVALLSSPASAQFDADSFTRYAEAARDSFDVSGMAIAIVKDDEIVYARGFGHRHLEDGGDVDEHTLFAIASNTKAFIATMIAQLVDEGRLDWDDRVREYLPGLHHVRSLRV